MCPIKDPTMTIATRQMFEEIGECHEVSIRIQELELQIKFYALSLKEMDIVLGAE